MTNSVLLSVLSLLIGSALVTSQPPARYCTGGPMSAQNGASASTSLLRFFQHASQLSLPSGLPTLTVTSTNQDITPPVITHFSLLKSAFQAPFPISQSPDQDVFVLVNFTDAGGVDLSKQSLDFTVEFLSPSGNITDVDCSPSVFSGTRTAGGFVARCYWDILVSSTSPQPGVWTLYKVTMSDSAKNTVTYTDAAVQLTVTNPNWDSTPPYLTFFGINPTNFNGLQPELLLNVTANATDTQSDVGDVYFGFTGPSGNVESRSMNIACNINAWYTSFHIRDDVYNGEWDLTVRITDSAMNSRSYTSNDLAARGFPSKFTVTGNVDKPTSSDVSPPVCNNLLITPSTVDVSSTSASISVSGCTDQSSFQVFVVLQPPATATSVEPFGVLAGTPATLPQNSAAGQWTVVNVGAYDEWGNAVFYGSCNTFPILCPILGGGTGGNGSGSGGDSSAMSMVWVTQSLWSILVVLVVTAWVL